MGAVRAFVFSPEDHTLAERMADIPTRKTAERRRAKLMELQQKIMSGRFLLPVKRDREGVWGAERPVSPRVN